MDNLQAALQKPAFNVGDVFHQYHVRRFLGAGLHGEVYLVEHRLTGEPFALKVMHLEDIGQASRVRRAISAAKATYAIRHANVVTVKDLGCEDDGKVWVLMEFLEGASVGELLGRQRGRVSVRLAFHIAIEAAWGIHAAHELGIIHRDIKPDNVWLTALGGVKVIDFSLAKVIPEGVKTTTRKTGVGTAPYMAPEALRGDDPDARFDLYALAVMLWQMLGGRHPWADVLRDTAEMVKRQLYGTVPSLAATAGLPAYVDEFFARALAKEPSMRFSSASVMAQAMMTLRDRLLADADRGLVDEVGPPGEPRIATDSRSRRAYEGAVMPMTVTPSRAMPDARVIVATTVPLAPPVGAGGTLPLDALPPAQTPPPAQEPMSPAVVAPPALVAAVSRSEAVTPVAARLHPTPPAMAISTSREPLATDARATLSPPSSSRAPSAPAARAVKRAPFGLIALALAAAICASIAVAALFRSRHASSPSVAPSATITERPKPASPAGGLGSTSIAGGVDVDAGLNAGQTSTATPSPTNEEAPSPPRASTAPTSSSASAGVPLSPSASARAPSRGLTRLPVPPTPEPVAPPPVPAPKPIARHRVFDAE